MRVVVGFQSTKSGRDSLALGARLARASGGELHVVLVLASNERATLAPPEVGYTRYLEEAGRGWLATVPAWLAEHGYDPEGVTTHLRFAESGAEGLLAVTQEVGGAIVVVGAARGGIARRFRVSGVANALLHAAEVPVALAPKGQRKVAPGGVSRVTAAIGLRPGASDVMTSAIRLADEVNADVRLLSLVALDQEGLGEHDDAAAAAAHVHVNEVLEQARATLPPGVVAETVVGQGRQFEDAVVRVDFASDEVVVVGSSRLASAGRLFLGATAARMLRELPVPMIVVPRDAALGE